MDSLLHAFVGNIKQYVLDFAIKYCAKIVECNGAYGFVVLEPVNKTSAETI